MWRTHTHHAPSVLRVSLLIQAHRATSLLLYQFQ